MCIFTGGSMKKIVFVCLITWVILILSAVVAAEEKRESPKMAEPAIAKEVYLRDPAADRAIIFGEKNGKLDIRLEGYTGMTEAAKDFMEYMKKQEICK